MITLICGDNLYKCEEALNGLVADSKDVVWIDLTESESFSKLAQAVQSDSLFTQNELVVARYGEEVTDIVERLNTILLTVSNSADLVLYFPNLKKLDAGKLKLQVGKFMENSTLDTEALISWIVDKAKSSEVELNRSVARFMIDWVGNDQMVLAKELEKLLLLGKPIQESTVREVAIPSPQTTIFQMLDAMISGQTKKALDYYNSLISGQFDAGYVMGMISWQAHALAVAVGGRGESQELINQTGISPYVLSKARQATQKLTKTQLIKINEAIVDMDKQLKTREIDETRAVGQLIRRISSAQRL